MTEPIIIALITSVASVIVALISALALTYKNLKKHIDLKTEEQKIFSDMSVQKLNGLLTSVIHSFDRPCWLKVAVVNSDGNIEFRMSEINDKYTEMFGIKRSHYIGKTDLEAGHTHKDSERFFVHDMTVFASGKPETFIETVKGENQSFRKLRVETPDGKTKGVFGYQVKDKDC